MLASTKYVHFPLTFNRRAIKAAVDVAVDCVDRVDIAERVDGADSIDVREVTRTRLVEAVAHVRAPVTGCLRLLTQR